MQCRRVETFSVRVDTPGGQRKTYSFDTLEEANCFVIGCEDKIVSGPIINIYYYDYIECD